MLFRSSAVYKILPGICKFPVRMQDTDSVPNRELVRWFWHEKSPILMGLNSFWEGVSFDDYVRSVIITKIPFPMKGDPIYVAKRERMQKRNRNVDLVAELDIPYIVKMVLQGFGRAIRTVDHQAWVTLLDDGFLSDYVKRFSGGRMSGGKVTRCLVESLPQYHIIRSEEEKRRAAEQVIEAAERFISSSEFEDKRRAACADPEDIVENAGDADDSVRIGVSPNRGHEYDSYGDVTGL